MRWKSTTRVPPLPVLARIPTVIACGDRDLLYTRQAPEEMAAALPDSLLVVVPGAAHLVQMERPEVINDALVRLVERATPRDWSHSPGVSRTRRVTEANLDCDTGAVTPKTALGRHRFAADGRGHPRLR